MRGARIGGQCSPRGASDRRRAGRESDDLDAFTFAHRAAVETPPVGLRVPGWLWSEVLAHLEGDAPAEAVGLLAVAEAPEGQPATGTRYFPGTNLDASPTRYTMDPVEVIAALREMDDRGWRLGAIVHSHPATAATPSATDLGEAYYPDALMVIVSLATAPPVARAWRIAAADGRGRPGAVIGEAPLAILRDRGGDGQRDTETETGAAWGSGNGPVRRNPRLRR